MVGFYSKADGVKKSWKTLVSEVMVFCFLEVMFSNFSTKLLLHLKKKKTLIKTFFIIIIKHKITSNSNKSDGTKFIFEVF